MTRKLLQRLGYHRFCQPAWRRIAATPSTGTTNRTGVLLCADYREHY